MLGNSKKYAFIKFASFEASDAAMDVMNGQYLCNRPIAVSYAFKKDSKGERHGSAADRFLAAQNLLSHADRPHQLFADDSDPMKMNLFRDHHSRHHQCHQDRQWLVRLAKVSTSTI